ncbi:hypothetical protein H2200_009623 [Cladophialophora chaetospira]|uniref:Uncharacterized protein n=1 Tax=Cladophialophora chaetospira TaxID=386627 RepID=A0AA38X2S5_9EURO|nr:hypothetical protein H2200_009623 [Cladophialophora chaetospira]
MSAADKAKKIVFINVPGDASSVPQRDRELQAAAARAHAARVSRRPTQNAGVGKHERGGPSRAKSLARRGGQSALALHTAPQKQRATVVKEKKEDGDTQLNKQRLYAVSTSSLGQGQVDPFDSAPVKGLDNFIYSALDFAYDYAFPSFVPAPPANTVTHRANRRRLGRQFGFLLEAQIVAAAKFQMSPMISLTENNRKRIQAINDAHEKRAVDLLNQEVQRLTAVPSDTLVYAAALLAYVSGPNYEWTSTGHPKSPLATAQNLHAMGHLQIVPDRVQTVRTLVHLRGGIDELSMPFQRIVLTYLDTIVSTRLAIHPGWTWPTAIPESLQRTGEHILDHTAAQLMQVMGSGFSEVQHERMHETLLLIWDVARMRVAVQHRLCSLNATSTEDTKLTDLQFRLCRLSALLYSDLVLFPIPDHAGVRPPLLYDLGRTLDKYEEASKSSPSNAEPNLLAWCVLLAAAASASNTVFLPQYIKRLEDLVSKDRRLRNWEFYKKLVRTFLWWGYLLDPLAWEAFSAVSWQDVYARDEGSTLEFSWRSTLPSERSLEAVP